MSATKSATASATSEAIAEWVKLFPRQVTETYTSSVTFMKQLTVIGISTITYLKNVFPEESYTSEKFGGVTLKILKKKCRDELAQFVSSSLTQAFEAFDKRYLYQLALCLYDGECHADNLIEYYIFEFTYHSDGVSLNLHSKSRDNVKRSTKYAFDNVREQTILLVRACVVVMQTCQYELPSSYDISLRLYYNDEAPEGYQAPGFVAAREPRDPLAGTSGAVTLGAVETRFHRLVARAYTRTDSPSSHEANASLNPPLMTQNEAEDICSPIEPEDVVAESRCPCNKPCVEGEPTLTCDYCGAVQHAACHGVPRGAASRGARHCCLRCAAADPSRPPTCLTLARLPLEKIEAMCIFRRTLEWCSLEQSIGLRALADKFQLTQSKAAKILKILEHHEVIDKDYDSDVFAQRKINRKGVKNAMERFFKSEDSDVVDRLLAETLSQGSQPDPVGAVLGPLQKVTLQNETTMGRIVEHTPPDSAPEDSTLKQYRQALITSNQRQNAELPLSGSHNPVKEMEKIGKKTTKRKIDEENRPVRAGVRTKRAKAIPK